MKTSASQKAHDYSGVNDEILAEKCKRRDEAAFQELMTRYLRPIFGFVRKYVQTEDNSSDVTQETFFKVWKNIKQFKKGMKFRPWLYTIARNSSLDFIKKKSAASFSSLQDDENDLSFVDTISDTAPLQDELFHNSAVKELLKDKVTLLHPDQEMVITMHYHEDMTFQEIAKALDKPMNTVKSWHHRAIIQLRKHLSNNKIVDAPSDHI